MLHMLIFYGLTIALFLLVSAFFSAAETALTAVSRARIYQLVMDGNKSAQIVSRLRREKESLIGTVLLGYNAVNIAASVLATSLSITYFGNGEGLVITTLVMTMLVVIFTEVLPKTYAIHNAERVSLRLAPSLQLCVRLLYPITQCIQLFIRGLFKLCGIDVMQAGTLISASDVLRGTIELHHREGKMVKQERDMLGSILDLGEIEVQEIMIHRKHVETINADQEAEALIAQAVGTMHSRIPVWQGEPDNIIGLLHVKNLIKMLKERYDSPHSDISTKAILALCTAPWFIPETSTLRDQLIAFRSRRQHCAFVVDEYGGWQGIVTLEDIIEEIVGEIEDEHDEDDHDIQKAAENIYYVNGSVSLRDLNRRLDWNLPDEDATTVAGLLIHETQTIPEIGEHFIMHGLRLKVLEKDALQITRLMIEKLPDTQLSPDADI